MGNEIEQRANQTIIIANSLFHAKDFNEHEKIVAANLISFTASVMQGHILVFDLERCCTHMSDTLKLNIN